jgi:hypothetical protein
MLDHPLESSDGTLDRIKGIAEWMQIQLSESAEDDGKVYYPFENIFEHGATQGVLKWWGEYENKLTRSMGYTVGTLQALDEYLGLPMHWLWVGRSTRIRHDLRLLHYTLSIEIDTKFIFIYPSLF